MRPLLVIVFLLTTCTTSFAQYPVPVHTPHYPHISDMSAMYGAVALELAGNRPGICTWVSNHFDYVVDYNANGGPVCENVNGQVYHLLYIEGSVITFNPGVTSNITAFYGLQTFSVAHSYVMEQMLSHQSQDYNHNIWTGLDKFDAYDNGNGVFLFNGSTYSDVSTVTYSGASNTTIPNGSTLYIGSEEPFDQMNWVIATARVGGSVTWQYWNGAWTTLTLHTDGTSGLTATGQAYFYPPSDWVQTSVNSSNNKFWVRAAVSGTSTAPIYTTIKGDTQLTGGLNRGWAVSQSACPGNTPNGSSCFINTGQGGTQTRLTYNANPPAGQTAHFLQQARTSDFTNDYVLMNPSDVQGGNRTMALWLETFINGLTPEGVMFDDAPNWPTDDRLTNMIEIPTNAGWITNKNAVFDKITGDWHATYGAHFLVGGNAQTIAAVCYHLDWCYAESVTYTSYAPQPESPNLFTAGQGPVFYDDMLTANNPSNIPASEMCFDRSLGPYNSYIGSLGNTGIYNTGTHYWDMGNRAPMTCLAQHYLAANPNTGFTYHTQGAFNYNLTDEVYVYGPATTTTSTITQGMSPGTITIASATGCGPFDYNGFGYLRVGTTSVGDTFYGTISGTTFTTSTTAANSYSSGNEAHCVNTVHQYQISSPPAVATVYAWATWFPAMAVDVGIPNAGGLSGGARVMPWKTGGSPDCISGLVCTGGAQTNCDNTGGSGDFQGRCANLHRRDYTKAIILYRDKKFPTKNVELDTYSVPVALGGTYYPMQADGTTGAAITTIRLRGSEGAILMVTPMGVGGAPGTFGTSTIGGQASIH